jgi:hypothetical protein
MSTGQNELPGRALSELISPAAFAAHKEAVDELEAKKRALQNPSDDDIDGASDADLRAMLKLVLKKQREQDAAAARPLGLDKFSGLPVHFEPPECPVCAPFVAQRTDEVGRNRYPCFDCDQLIPIEDAQEFGATGLWSSSITHMHMHTVMGGHGEQIRIPGRRNLCLECFRRDYEATNLKPCDL